ncbi:hypothetical protein [Solitalea koreensis]|uniref:Phosphate-selective porin O and P n=1 Tax=Solitalea koreensis TaxID=543615 RepID=A0A521DXX9_9SPHI|nr:hypothetical protein [Solitalea koreensis]SMO76577.1 hypothetical protein SAMN06265350_10959 [Solitalea koreensis]
MKKRSTFFLSIFFILIGSVSYAQQPDLQYFRANDKTGLNVFETSKQDTVTWDNKLKVRIGGAFGLQYQALDHQNDANNLVHLISNFNLPNANLDLDVQLYDGVRMHLRTYLSSRHHTETYVKGGYIQIDKLDFIKKDFAANIMKYVTIKIGQMENNYGDAHFRRTDNAHGLFNPFVGNYIMDSFTTEIGGEVYYQSNGWLGMLGITNGRLNQSVADTATKGAFIAKLGYDKQISADLRLRLTGSLYTVNATSNTYLYGGDRGGSRYYKVMDILGASTNDFSGRINPALKTDMTSFMINPFVKYKGLEFFGVFETTSGRDKVADAAFTGERTWTQLAGELIYRFGAKEQLYAGGRYNTVKGQLPGVENDMVKVDRFNIGGGWFMTKNIVAKLEYVNQQYKDYPVGNSLQGGKFDGFMLEAMIAF